MRITTTGTKGSRILGIAALIGIAWLVVFGLVLSPEDERPGRRRAPPVRPRAVGLAGLPGLLRHLRRLGLLPRAAHPVDDLGPGRRTRRPRSASSSPAWPSSPA